MGLLIILWLHTRAGMRCRAAAGALSSRAVVISSGRSASVSSALSYDTPRVSSITPHNVSVDVLSRGFPLRIFLAHVTARLTGSNNSTQRRLTASYSETARIQGSSCESTRWHSSSGITCTVPGGLFEASRTAVVTAAAHLVGSISRAFSYLPLRLTGAHTSNMRARLDGQHLVGYFSGVLCSPASRVGHSSVEASSWISETSIRTKPGAGLGALLAVEITIAGMRSRDRASHAATYDAPAIALASSSQFAQGGGRGGNLPLHRQGSQHVLLLLASSLGLSDATSRVRVAGTDSQSSSWISDTAAAGAR